MELYNIFTEQVRLEDDEKSELLLHAFSSLCQQFPHGDFHFIRKENSISIIGQFKGADTSIGDTDLAVILEGIEYTWFDAYSPSINNIEL